MAHVALSLFSLVGLVFLLVVPHLLLHVSCKAGFSVDLIHRDSPKSHPASTPLSRLHSSIRHSASFADYLGTANPGNANSSLVSINNEGGGANPGNANSPLASINKRGVSVMVTSYYSYYLVSFQIGSNKHNVYTVLEVADDFIWLFCKPCPTCPADRPIFDPSESINSYLKRACVHQNCKLLLNYNCDDKQMCHFSHKYNPGTAIGTLSRDTVTMSSTKQKRKVPLPHIIFGCTNAIKGKHFKDSMGILGLGSGPLSLVSQMSMVYGKKFSYCLPSNNGDSSYLYFGSAAKVKGQMWITPLDSSESPFHKITLTSITVTGGRSHPTINKIVISTSIFTTHIDMDSLKFIWEEVVKHVPLHHIMYPGYDLCYDTSSAPTNLKIPEIKLIFTHNAELVLEEDNAFVRVGNTMLCLAILSNKHTSGTSVLGSLAQKGNLMLFDVDKGNLYFRRGVC